MILHYENEKMLAILRTTLDAALIIFLYIGGVLTLNMPIDYHLIDILTVIGASLAGAVVLVYYRRELSYKEIFFKVGCAAILGVVCGSVITTYFNLHALPYVFAVYFFSSLLAIFIIRGLLSVTEQNATNIVITVLQTLIRSAPRGLPQVTPNDTARNVTTVEQTEITIRPSSAGAPVDDKKSL